MQSKNGKPKTLIIGGTGGIGSALVKKIQQCDSISSKNLDLNQPETIKLFDFSTYETVINAAGHSRGTFLGFQNNTFENITSQINVNYLSNLLILKQFAQQCSKGTYVWIGSDVMDHPRPFHSVYASSKVASQYAMDLIRKEIDHIRILEIKIGLTKTNFRFNNFLGTKTKSEIDSTYPEDIMEAEYVADRILESVNSSETFKHIKHET
jgi:short-subunit dehydrogenase